MASQIDLEINANFDKVNKALGSLVKETEKQTASIQKSFSNAFLGIAAVATAALGAISFKEMIHAATEADKVVTRLNVALKVSGNFTKQTSEEFQKLGEEIERTTGVTDETINALIATAQGLGLTTKETKNLITASSDVAAVLGTDVQDAAVQLEKTLSGNVPRALGILFPEIKKLSAEALASGEAIRLLGDRFKGAGAAVVENFGGQLKIAGVGLENILENAGKVITQNPLFVAGIKAAGAIFFDLAETISKNTTAIIKFTNQGIVSLIRGLQSVIGFVVEFRIAITALGLSLSVALATPAVLASFAFLSKIFKQIAIDIALATTASNLFKASITFGISLAIAALIELFRKFENPLQFVVLKFREASVAVLTFLKTFSSGSVAGAFQKQIDSLNETIAQTTAEASKLRDGQEDLGKGINENLDQTAKYIEGLQERISLETTLTNATVKASDERSKAIQQEVDAQRQRIKAAQAEIVKSAAASPFDALFGQNVSLGKFQQEKGVTGSDVAAANAQAGVGAGVGLLGQAVSGKGDNAGLEAASKTISSIVGGLANTLLPGIGQAATQLFEALSQGPQAIQALIKSFIDAIPKVLDAIVAALPVILNNLGTIISTLLLNVVKQLPFIVDAIVASIDDIILGIVSNLGPIIDALIAAVLDIPRLLLEQIPLVLQSLADKLPGIIQKLVEDAPRIISELISKLPVLISEIISKLPTIAIQFAIALAGQSAYIATTFSIELIKQLPTIIKSFITGLLTAVKEGFKNLFSGIFGGGEGGGGGILGSIKGALGSIGKAFGFAEGGIVPQGFNNDSFPARLSSGERIVSAGENERLSQFLDRAEQGGGTGAPQNLTVNLMIGEEQLANVILQLNQRGFRLN